MRRFLKISMTLSIVICLFAIGCGERKKSNIDILKEYFLMDENLYVIHEDEDKQNGLEQSSKIYIHDKKGNKVQYILEHDFKINDDKRKKIESYVLEFREDGVYTAEKRNVYENLEDIENLIDIVEDSYFDKTLLKMPLEVGTTWDYNKNKDATYKIEEVSKDNIVVSIRGKEAQGQQRIIDNYKKGVGSSNGVGYTSDGEITYKDITRTEKRE